MPYYYYYQSVVRVRQAKRHQTHQQGHRQGRPRITLCRKLPSRRLNRPRKFWQSMICLIQTMKMPVARRLSKGPIAKIEANDSFWLSHHLKCSTEDPPIIPNVPHVRECRWNAILNNGFIKLLCWNSSKGTNCSSLQHPEHSNGPPHNLDLENVRHNVN